MSAAEWFLPRNISSEIATTYTVRGSSSKGSDQNAYLVNLGCRVEELVLNRLGIEDWQALAFVLLKEILRRA